MNEKSVIVSIHLQLITVKVTCKVLFIMKKNIILRQEQKLLFFHAINYSEGCMQISVYNEEQQKAETITRVPCFFSGLQVITDSYIE